MTQEQYYTASEKISDLDVKNKKFSNLISAIKTKIIGQDDLIENMITCLIAGGHILIEGLPGLAKTATAKALSDGIEGDFHRIQFTPDLLPSDLIGSDIYIQESSNFEFRSGPIFHNIVLADEINRAPSKVQSALLEAMAEKQVTVGKKTYPLPELFMVMATQNPIEQEGTYNLPEAQLDRFLMNVIIGYPSKEDEMKILDLSTEIEKKISKMDIKITTQEEIFAARKASLDVYIDDKLKNYIIDLVSASRNAKDYDQELGEWIRCGVSPRATLALLNCSKILALISGDSYVTPDHIKKVLPNIMRHRLILSYEAEASNISKDDVIQRLMEVVALP